MGSPSPAHRRHAARRRAPAQHATPSSVAALRPPSRPSKNGSGTPRRRSRSPSSSSEPAFGRCATSTRPMPPCARPSVFCLFASILTLVSASALSPRPSNFVTASFPRPALPSPLFALCSRAGPSVCMILLGSRSDKVRPEATENLRRTRSLARQRRPRAGHDLRFDVARGSV